MRTKCKSRTSKTKLENTSPKYELTQRRSTPGRGERRRGFRHHMREETLGQTQETPERWHLSGGSETSSASSLRKRRRRRYLGRGVWGGGFPVETAAPMTQTQKCKGVISIWGFVSHLEKPTQHRDQQEFVQVTHFSPSAQQHPPIRNTKVKRSEFHSNHLQIYSKTAVQTCTGAAASLTPSCSRAAEDWCSPTWTGTPPARGRSGWCVSFLYCCSAQSTRPTLEHSGPTKDMEEEVQKNVESERKIRVLSRK